MKRQHPDFLVLQAYLGSTELLSFVKELDQYIKVTSFHSELVKELVNHEMSRTELVLKSGNERLSLV